MAENDEQEGRRKGALVYAAGLGIFFAVLVCLGLGWLLDRWLGTAPWLLVTGLLLGSVVGLYEFIRVTSKLN